MRKCGKTVNKLVEKMVQKMWMLNVKKCELWNNLMLHIESFAQKPSFTRVFPKSFDTFCTNNLLNLPLLNMSFTSFAHRTTITTTILLMEKE